MTIEKPKPENRLSDDLEALIRDGQPLSLGAIESRLKGRGFALLILILSAPFMVPNIPGLSTPFGFAILIMGIRIMLGRKPWLPEFILKMEISAASLKKIIGLLLKGITRMEKVVRPRMAFFYAFPGMSHVIGFGIAASAFYLMLPLPIPFSNTLPAVSIILLAAGMMERDGLLVLLGHIIGVIGYVYLGFWLVLGKAGLEWLIEVAQGWLSRGGGAVGG